MLTLDNLPEAERFVARQQRLGNDVRWEGWDMIFFRPSEKGLYSKHGAFRNGEWGFENRTPVSENGTWEVDYRNVRRAKRSQ